MKPAAKRQTPSARKASKQAATAKARKPIKPARQTRYSALLAAKEAAAGDAKAQATDAVIAKLIEDATPPDDWSKLSRGSLCLALENPGDGWFEAVVIKLEGERASLVWVGWPDLPPFTKTVSQLALRHPKRTPGC